MVKLKGNRKGFLDPKVKTDAGITACRIGELTAEEAQALKEARDAEEVAERMEKMHVKRDKEKKKNVRTMLGVRHSATNTSKYRPATVRCYSYYYVL